MSPTLVREGDGGPEEVWVTWDVSEDHREVDEGPEGQRADPIGRPEDSPEAGGLQSQVGGIMVVVLERSCMGILGSPRVTRHTSGSHSHGRVVRLQ